jgi:hypothetical protein
LNVIIREPSSGRYEVEIYSVGGTMELNQVIMPCGDNILKIKLPGLPAGVYITRIRDDYGTKSFKFIKE